MTSLFLSFLEYEPELRTAVAVWGRCRGMGLRAECQGAAWHPGRATRRGLVVFLPHKAHARSRSLFSDVITVMVVITWEGKGRRNHGCCSGTSLPLPAVAPDTVPARTTTSCNDTLPSSRLI